MLFAFGASMVCFCLCFGASSGLLLFVFGLVVYLVWCLFGVTGL